MFCVLLNHGLVVCRHAHRQARRKERVVAAPAIRATERDVLPHMPSEQPHVHMTDFHFIERASAVRQQDDGA